MRNFRTIKEDFIKYKWYLITGFAVLVLVDVLQLIIPRILKYAIDSLVGGNAQHGLLLKYALYIVLIALTIGVFRFFWRYFIAGTARRIERNLRLRLFSHLENLGMRFYSNTKVGDLMAHATNDVDAVRRTVGMGIIIGTDILVLGSLSIVFMVLINLKLTLIALIPFPLLIFIVLRFGKLIHKRFEEVQAGFSNLSSCVEESVRGIRVVRGYNQEQGEIKKFLTISRDYIKRNVNLIKVWGFFFPIMFFFANLSIWIILRYGGVGVITATISMGDFVAFQSYLMILVWPMIAIGWVVNMVQRGSASMGRINKLLETPPEIKDTGKAKIKKIRGIVDIKGVYFSYNGRPIIKNISLHAEPGKKIGIVGGIGSGKSTLVTLIARLYEVERGDIMLDSMPIKEIPLETLRRSIGFVPQDVFLFSDTIRENIRFGNTYATDDEIVEAVRLCGLSDEIEKFPNGLDTVVGERGIALSGGQRQRVTLTRSIIKKPSILILDDALSSVDTEKEAEIIDNLSEFLKERTTFVVSHRLKSLIDADEIIVLRDGEIIEKGIHQELIRMNGFYANLFRLQQLEEVL